MIASVVSVTNSLLAGSILRYGSEEQKQQWLPKLASGEMKMAFAITEPQAAALYRRLGLPPAWRLPPPPLAKTGGGPMRFPVFGAFWPDGSTWRADPDA